MVLQRMIARKAVRLGWLRLIEQTTQATQDQTQPAAPQVIPLPTEPVPVQGSSADG